MIYIVNKNCDSQFIQNHAALILNIICCCLVSSNKSNSGFGTVHDHD